MEFHAKAAKLGISDQVFSAYASGNILKPVIKIDLVLGSDQQRLRSQSNGSQAAVLAVRLRICKVAPLTAAQALRQERVP